MVIFSVLRLRILVVSTSSICTCKNSNFRSPCNSTVLYSKFNWVMKYQFNCTASQCLNTSSIRRSIRRDANYRCSAFYFRDSIRMYLCSNRFSVINGRFFSLILPSIRIKHIFRSFPPNPSRFASITLNT